MFKSCYISSFVISGLGNILLKAAGLNQVMKGSSFAPHILAEDEEELQELFNLETSVWLEKCPNSYKFNNLFEWTSICNIQYLKYLFCP